MAYFARLSWRGRLEASRLRSGLSNRYSRTKNMPMNKKTTKGVPLNCEKFVETLPEPIIAIDHKGIIQRMNPAAARYFGYPTEKLVGKNVSILMPSPEKEQHDDYLKKYLTTRQATIIGMGRRVTVQKADKTLHPVYLTVSEQVSQDGRVFFIGMLRDLHQLQTAEEDLALLGEVVKSSLAEVYIFGAEDFRFKFVNQGARNNLDYTLSELESKHPWDLKPSLQEVEFKKLIEPVTKGIVPSINFKTAHRRKDGSTYPVDIWVQRTTYKGIPSFLVHALDRTEQQNLERELKSILEASPAHIFKINTDYEIQYINHVVPDLDDEHVVGHNFLNFLEIPHREIAERAIERAKASKRSVTWENSRSSLGRVHYYSSTCNPLLDDSGVIGYVVSALDITEKREMELQIQHSARLAQIGELAAGVGHEINNPLAIMNGNVELIVKELKRGTPNLKQVNVRMEKCQLALWRIRDIVNGLKSFAREDTSSEGPTDIREAIGQTLFLVREMFHKENVLIEYEEPDRISMVKGASGRLQQIIMNLLVNAKDALQDKNGGLIRLTLHEDNKFVYLEVVDNGPGISEEIIENIFTPFFTTKAIGQGTGMGLSLSQSLVKDLGGGIKAESRVGEGARFTVQIPVSMVHCPHVASITASECGHQRDLMELRVLVVDDEEDIRDLLGEMLVGFGVKHQFFAIDGQDALEILKNEDIDILLTDMRMPRMDGINLIREVRNQSIKPQPTIFLVTGGLSSTCSDEERNQINSLVDGIILKPFVEEDVQKVLTCKRSKAVRGLL